MKILLASKSKIKAETVRDAVALLFPNSILELVQHDVEDPGPEPFGNDAVINQIRKSIEKIQENDSDADFYIGMEGGVREYNGEMEEIAYVMVSDKTNRISLSQAVSFPIPPNVAQKVREGIPFATAVDELYSTKDIKNNQGFVGLLTNGVVDKKALYFQPTVVALSKFVKNEWFWK